MGKAMYDFGNQMKEKQDSRNKKIRNSIHI